MSKYNIKEIAKICNTSPTTVSRVLNHPELVAKSLRQEILDKMNEVGYKPNPFASRLSSKSQWGIALFVFDILNPFFAMIVRKIGHKAMEHHIPITICDTENNEEKELMYLEYLLENKVGGIIFTEGISAKTIEKASKVTNTVMIDRHFQEGIISEVTSDNYMGGCQATEYLIQLQHKNIGFIGGPKDWTSVEDRFRGYKDTLIKYKIPFRSDLIFQGNLRFESGIEAFEYFLSLPVWPTAIFCANDQMAFGVLTKARSMGISIPGDISLVGFDDIPLYNRLSTELTAVQQDIEALCEHSFKLMMNKIELAESDEKPKRIIIPTKLKIGETCTKCPQKQ